MIPALHMCISMWQFFLITEELCIVFIAFITLSAYHHKNRSGYLSYTFYFGQIHDQINLINNIQSIALIQGQL